MRVFCISIGANSIRRGIPEDKITRWDKYIHKVYKCRDESKVLQSTSPTCLTFGVAAHPGALDGRALWVHTPAVADAVPALHGQVVPALVTLGLVETDLGLSKICIDLTIGLDDSDWGMKREQEDIKDQFKFNYWWLQQSSATFWEVRFCAFGQELDRKNDFTCIWMGYWYFSVIPSQKVIK